MFPGGKFQTGEDSTTLLNWNGVHAAEAARQPNHLVRQIVGMDNDGDAGPVAKREILGNIPTEIPVEYVMPPLQGIDSGVAVERSV
jgi:hypothetical protein